MRKEVFEEGNFYHVYGRGVDKRPIFCSDRDRIRFVNSFYILNNFLTIPPRFDVIRIEPFETLTPIKPYVEVGAGCLMDNHYHFLLSPNQKGGISAFMQKLGTSYTMYFNKLHERTGRLFESSFKAKHIDRQDYATYISQYIHLNPADLYQAKPGTTVDNLLEKIEAYEWSTLPDYLGKKSGLSILLPHAGMVTFRNEVLDLTAEEYRRFLHELYRDLYQAKPGTDESYS